MSKDMINDAAPKGSMTSEDALFEKMFDVLLDDVAPEVSERLGNEYEEQDCGDFSDMHKHKMKKLFRQSRRKISMKKFARFSQRAAVVLLAMIVLSGAMVMSVEAWRVRFLNMFVTETPSKSEIVFIEGSEFSNDIVTLNYIPEGFTLSVNEMNGDILFLRFEKSNDFFCLELCKAEGVLSVDTEDASTRQTKVNSYDAFCSTKEYGYILAWTNQKYSFCLSGNIDELQMMRIAENIR